MALFVIGCNHRTAPLELRESVAFPRDLAARALRIAREERVLGEAVLVSTCNRTEVYGCAADPAAAEAYARDLVERLKGAGPALAAEHGYAFRDRDAARHLFRVAAGLDSMKLGEIQILGQVKDAHRLAGECGSAGIVLNRLFDAASRVGKRARSETAIGEGAVSVASAAVALAGRVFESLRDKVVLVVGAGDTGRLAARHFAEQRPARILVANRTLEKAASVAAEAVGEPLALADLPAALARSDVVVCATSAPGVLIDAETVRAAVAGRGARPLVFVDIAVPRDVDPAVRRIENVFVHTIDALRTLVDRNLERRKREVPRVEAIVEEEVERFVRWLRSLEVTPTVRELRERFEQVRAEELTKHLRHFSEADRRRVEVLTRGLINKLLHRPTTRIKSIDLESDEGPRRLEAIREIFGLDAGGRGAVTPEAEQAAGGARGA